MRISPARKAGSLDGERMLWNSWLELSGMTTWSLMVQIMLEDVIKAKA